MTTTAIIIIIMFIAIILFAISVMVSVVYDTDIFFCYADIVSVVRKYRMKIFKLKVKKIGFEYHFN